MGKYIDADLREKIVSEVEQWKEKTANHYTIEAEARWSEADYILGIIDSPQQEQPKLPGYDKALLEVKSRVDDLYEEAGIGLCEYDSGLYNGIAETCMKLQDFIKARLGSDEQPEVDLVKEYDENFWNDPVYGKLINRNAGIGVARHFYELGLNARKEEQK